MKRILTSAFSIFLFVCWTGGFAAVPEPDALVESDTLMHEHEVPSILITGIRLDSISMFEDEPAPELLPTATSDDAEPKSERKSAPDPVPAPELAAVSDVASPTAETPAAETPAAETPTASPAAAKSSKRHFLPARRRMDREIDKVKYVYKGEMMMGLTASYGTLTSDDTDFLVIVENINADGTIASVKPYFGYFYRDNRCLGVRFGYTYVDAELDSGTRFDLGDGNDISFDIPYVGVNSNNYSFGIFHRTYAGLDPKGRFGLFAEVELSVSSGESEFSYENNGTIKTTNSENFQAKFSFNPGAAVYIFPNVCATLSFGLGGIQYTHVSQKDAEGNKIGSRTTSKMRFRLNLAAINIGMTVHLWNKKK